MILLKASYPLTFFHYLYYYTTKKFETRESYLFPDKKVAKGLIDDPLVSVNDPYRMILVEYMILLEVIYLYHVFTM